MKFVQTFWTGTATLTEQSTPLMLRAGWYTSEYHWMSWALSCLQLLKLYGQVELVTDKLGKHILIDTLGLPYTSVSLVLEGQLEGFYPRLFSLAKIKTYSLQQEPFIHVDGDLFLFQPLPDRVMQSGLISSNPEADLFFNAEVVKQVGQEGYVLPDHLKDLNSVAHLFSSNAGIIGGNDLPFIQEYCNHAFDFITSNSELMKGAVPDGINFLIEQISFFYLARAKGKEIAYISEEPVTDPLYQDFIRVADIPDVPMVHAVGGCKRFPFMLDHLARRLRLHYPDYHYRILALCKQQQVKMSNSFYACYNWSYNRESRDLSVHTKESEDNSAKPLNLVFERTIKALSHALPDMPLPETHADFSLLLERDQVPPQCKDILRLELLIEKVQDSLVKGGETAGRYAQDREHFRKTDELFNAGVSVEVNQKIGLSESTRLHTALWNWWKSDDEDMKEVLAENFSTEPDQLVVSITPDLLTMDAYVYYLDALDAYLIEVLKVGETSIADVLERVRHAFEEDIDPETNLEYRYLIFDTLKRLSFNRIICF
ncbi:MAG: hypothetical protein HEP71_04640 [Roseivirga sp.]|nr:hypothetical protein [Roseivirga sp.]